MFFNTGNFLKERNVIKLPRRISRGRRRCPQLRSLKVPSCETPRPVNKRKLQFLICTNVAGITRPPADSSLRRPFVAHCSTFKRRDARYKKYQENKRVALLSRALTMANFAFKRSPFPSLPSQRPSHFFFEYGLYREQPTVDDPAPPSVSHPRPREKSRRTMINSFDRGFFPATQTSNGDCCCNILLGNICEKFCFRIFDKSDMKYEGRQGGSVDERIDNKTKAERYSDYRLKN